MKITCFENSLLESNSYLVELGDQLILIDPSNEGPFLKLIENSKLEPAYIFLTHEHIDHITGIVKIKKNYKDLMLLSTEYTSNSVIDPKKNLSVFHGFEYVGIQADITIDSCYEFEIASTKINLFPCKGHSLGGMFIKINNVVFIGDEFIFELKTVTKLPGGSKSELLKSYEFLKSSFKETTLLYPGHGQKFLLKQLKVW